MARVKYLVKSRPQMSALLPPGSLIIQLARLIHFTTVCCPKIRMFITPDLLDGEMCEK